MSHNSKSSKKSSSSSIRSTTPSVSSTAISSAKAVGRGLKRIKNGASKIIRPLKRAKHALSTVSSPAISDAEDDPASINTNETPEVIEVGSDGEELDDLEKELGKSLFILFLLSHSFHFAAAAKKSWRSPVYSFFNPEVTIEIHKGRVSHVFTCSAKKCKSTRNVRRYQDTGDKSSTANLRHHAVRCFSEDIVKNGESGGSRSGNIFSAFARQGQQSVTYSHRAHSSTEFRYVHNFKFYVLFLRLMYIYISAHIAKWVAESNRPANIVSDPELINLLTTGHPHLKVPSPNTVRRDIKAAYLKCRERITNLLRDHSGRVHFATDAWTSTNHYAFVAWTVHLEHEGTMLTFLLDLIEVPESHTGAALAMAFQRMLETFQLQNRVRL
jgi:hypothetical protein